MEAGHGVSVAETTARDWSREARLRDESVVLVRPIASADVAAWRSFYARLSDQTIYRRFFGGHPNPSDVEVDHFVTVDYVERMAFVVEQKDAIIGIGRYDRIGTIGAEIALAVADGDQGRGVGTLLLQTLVEHAVQGGVHQFLAATLVDNATMLNIFHRAGFHVQSPARAGVIRVALDLTSTAHVPVRP